MSEVNDFTRLHLVPRPRFGRRRSGELVISLPLTVCGPNHPILDRLVLDLSRSLDGTIRRCTCQGCEAALRFTFSPGDAGAYALTIDQAVLVTASDADGLASSVATLRQLVSGSLFSHPCIHHQSLPLPRLHIIDAPSFSWRGAHLDVTRHFFSTAVVCRFMDLLHLHKVNHLHLHLNDDQGWRVEVASWPNLTEIGAWRSSTSFGRIGELKQDGMAHGGFYTTQDIALLIHHAAGLGITLVPEIDFPGHALSALAAYPEFGNTGEQFSVGTQWGISDHVLNMTPEAIAFATSVTSEVASLFPGSPVHIGGDECPTTEWKHSDVAQRLMARHGFRDVRELQGLYTTELAQTVTSLGRKVLAWDEVLDAEVPPETIIVAWRHFALGIRAARAGHQVVMAPMEFTYLDWAQSEDPSEPMAILPSAFATTWQKVYGFAIIPSTLEESLHSHILGAQVQVWSEYISTQEHMDYMVFPRLCAFSEVVWGTQGQTRAFSRRLAAHLERLSLLGVDFRPLGD